MSINFAFLNRLAFGPSDSDLRYLTRVGLRAWVQEQLKPDESADSESLRRLAQLKIRIRYPQGKDWPAVDELRPLQWLEAPVDKVWPLNDPAHPVAPPEKSRPRVEITMATLTRAVYSRWQLREVLCDFWHNHFNVNAWDQTVGMALPAYDHEVIRRHCLGNFREMLGSVAKSTAMLWYLNNRSSRTGAPNENYARELFELHALGRDAYLNGIYNRWRDVPGATQGQPSGYIDQDVYEAARAFTGWGVEDGSGLGGGQALPRSGRFVYVESWHDNYQKRVLGNELDPYQPAMADGQRVLNLAAYHPATARHLVTKLARRLVADTPPESLIAPATKLWLSLRDKPDQIARVAEFIALSRECVGSLGTKVKRPLELLASFVRATGIDFTPTEALIGELDAAGQRLFGFPTPNGHPDQGDYWLGSNALRRRWTLMSGLAENWWGTGPFDPLSLTPSRDTQGFINHWLLKLHGDTPAALQTALLTASRQAADKLLGNPGLARRLVAWAAMTPEYQVR